MSAKSFERTSSVLKSTSQISSGSSTAKSATPCTTTNSSSSSGDDFVPVISDNSCRTELRRERQFASHARRVSPDFLPSIRIPKRRQRVQIQNRAFVRRQKIFPLQPFRPGFKRRQFTRIFQRDMLEKLVVRRAGIRRAQFPILPRFRACVAREPFFRKLNTENLFRFVIQFFRRLPPQCRDRRLGLSFGRRAEAIFPRSKFPEAFRKVSSSSSGSSVSVFCFPLSAFSAASSVSSTIRQRRCGSSPCVSLWPLDFELRSWFANHKPSQSAKLFAARIFCGVIGRFRCKTPSHFFSVTLAVKISLSRARVMRDVKQPQFLARAVRGAAAVARASAADSDNARPRAAVSLSDKARIPRQK